MLRVDFTGQKFNRWTVISYAGQNAHGQSLWKVRCGCKAHTERIVTGQNLKGKQTQSCGCIQREQKHHCKWIDLTGQKFDRWTVIEHVGKNKQGHSLWKCRCSCKDRTEGVLIGTKLTNKRAKSCGCIRREQKHSTRWVDLTGEKFGRWTVIEFAGIDKHENSLWKCRCCCKEQTEKVIVATVLKNKHSQSCGCILREQEHNHRWIDRTGQRWGRLTFIESAKVKNLQYKMYWLVRCRCGKYTIAIWGGGTKSCGCLHTETRRQCGIEGKKVQTAASALPPIAPAFETTEQLMDFINKL
jgi:hypothetical protein